MTIIYLLNSCRKVGPVQQTLYIISHLDREKFTPILITLREEPEDEPSLLNNFLNLGIVHYHISTSKSDIIFGRLSNLKNRIDSLCPDVIHSMGVFPDYAVRKIGYSDRQLITLRNYMKDDYYSKFGKIRGKMLEWLQMSAVRRAKKVITCSKSLSCIYQEREHLNFDWICNGVETQNWRSVSREIKSSVRRKLGLPEDKKIFVYSASLIPRKNQKFLLGVFRHECMRNHLLLLLGDGTDMEAIRHECVRMTNVKICGNVDNVGEYLQASDIYISSSLSEGMPNSVLEAMASGLPVILSHIRQHEEIFDINPKIGELFDLSDEIDCLNKIMKLLDSDVLITGKEAECCAKNDFSAEKMSRQYQYSYENIMNNC